jgi:hypothetical protein
MVRPVGQTMYEGAGWSGSKGPVSVSLQSVTLDLSIGTTDPFIVLPAFGLAVFRLGRLRPLARPRS